jgi:hypothetical protein
MTRVMTFFIRLLPFFYLRKSDCGTFKMQIYQNVRIITLFISSNNETIILYFLTVNRNDNNCNLHSMLMIKNSVESGGICVYNHGLSLYGGGERINAYLHHQSASHVTWSAD